MTIKAEENDMSNEVKKEDFLYKSIDDATSTIRAMDMKSNVLMAFIGAIIFVLVRIQGEEICGFAIFTMLWGIGTAIGFIYGVVLPGFNPVNEIDNIDKLIINEDKKTLFFPFKIRSIDTYYSHFDSAKSDDLLKVLTLERLKLQVLIERKINFFKISLYWGGIPFLFFVLISLVKSV